MPTELPEIKSEIKAEDFITNSSSNDSPHHSSQTPNTLVDPQLQSATTTCGWVGKKITFFDNFFVLETSFAWQCHHLGFAFYNHKLMIKPKYKLSVRTHTFSFFALTYERAAEVISDQRIFVFDRQYR